MSIDSGEIEQLISEAINNSLVKVAGGDGKYQVEIVSDIFSGLNAVKRQQAVYKILNPHITSGVIHAVSMSLFTDAEWASKE